MTFIQKILDRFKLLDLKKDVLTPKEVAKIFNISEKMAKYFLEIAKKQGVFSKEYTVFCPLCKESILSYEFKFLVPKKMGCNKEPRCRENKEFFTDGSIQEIYSYRENS